MITSKRIRRKLLLLVVLGLLIFTKKWYMPYFGVNMNELHVEVVDDLRKESLIIKNTHYSEPFQSKDTNIVFFVGKLAHQIVNNYGENDFLFSYGDTCFLAFRHFKTLNKQRDSYHFQIYKLNGKVCLRAKIEGTDRMFYEGIFDTTRIRGY